MPSALATLVAIVVLPVPIKPMIAIFRIRIFLIAPDNLRNCDASR
jgi:hypothetical protein